jgi:methionine sulfoxide reductase heme-binding subunit
MNRMAVFTIAAILGIAGGWWLGLDNTWLRIFDSGKEALGGTPATRLIPDSGGHGAWYASRAAGVASYVFIWLGLAGGFAMSSAWFDGIVGRGRLLAIHQTGSIAGLVLGAFHAIILIPDGWTRFGYWDLFVPFGSYYEPLLSAIGTLALYLGIVVSASFWFRTQIGVKRWKMLHYSSFLVYAGALYHGLNLGTDSNEVWLIAIYLVTSLTVVFWLMVRITYTRTINRRVAAASAAAVAATPEGAPQG